MRRRINQRNDWGQGGCYLFGVRFNEQTVRGMDAVVVGCFVYMVIYEASNYNEYRSKGGCIKPFGLFWIGNFASIVMSRIFNYLWKYFDLQYALLLIGSDNTRITRARFWAHTMKVGKWLAYCGFLVFTILGSIWFVQDGRCLTDLDKESYSNKRSWRKTAFWLFTSLTACLVYSVRVITKLIYKITSNRELEQVEEIRRVNLFLWADQFSRQEGRSLTRRELNLFRKSKLCSYSELSRSNKEPSKHSQQTLIEMTTLRTIERTSENEETSREIDYSDLKQGEIEHYQVTCAVCLEDIEIGQWYKRLPNCEHCFHATCIDQWLLTRATCPICREEIYFDESILEHQGVDEKNPA